MIFLNFSKKNSESEIIQFEMHLKFFIVLSRILKIVDESKLCWKLLDKTYDT